MRLIVLLTLGLFLGGCDTTPQDPTLNLNDSEHAQHIDSFDRKTTLVSTPLLQSYYSCENLSDEMRKAALDKMHADFDRMLKNPPRYESSATCGAMPSAAAAPIINAPRAAEAAPALVEGVDFSGTNNQEKGVDEADIIKLDGKFFYILSKSTLTIFAISESGQLGPASVVNLASPGTGLLLKGDQLLVFAQETTSSNTRIDIINLGADRKKPVISDSYYVPGEIVGARRIGENFHLATFVFTAVDGLEHYPSTPDGYYDASEEEQNQIWAEEIAKVVKHNEEIIATFDFLKLVPRRFNLKDTGLQPWPLDENDCAQTYGQEGASENGFLNLISLTPQPNNKDNLELTINRVRGNKPIVYASQNQFILASRDHEPWWFYNNEDHKDQTSIHRFDLSQEKFPVYQDSISVPGKINNSFSLSEHKGYLRVATTTNTNRGWWSVNNNEENQEQNNLYILGDQDNKFSIVGSLEGLAPGEKIWSARYANDLCFLVTFKQVDPLFTLDLSDPFNPKVAGELKVPGASTYLQDIGDDKLLAIGYGGDDNGLDFNTNVSIFDVSDLSKPALLDTFSFAAAENTGNRSISSEANQNHLAINYFAPKALTAIPISASRFVANPLAVSGGRYENITKLALIDTKIGEDLKLHGHVDHSRFYQNNRDSYYPPAIRRSYFVGDYIYAISPNGITGSRLSDMEIISGYQL
jgi:uncharacterized secreted protein with C-terminal beta-propeller domain